MGHARFFLTGAPKSGTTWLGKLLDAHPEISCRGEACVHHFGQRLVEAAKSYNQLLAQRKAVITDANDFPQLPFADVLTLMRTFLELRFQSVADPAKPGLKILGEKDPEHALHFKDLGPLLPESKFIHIIRDGRGVFVSAWHHNVRSNYEHLKTHDFDAFLDITAREWSDRVRRAREGAKLLGDRYLEVRYEDLIAAPEPELARILAFLGAVDDEATLRACVDAASFEKLSQGRKAGDEDKASFFRKGDPEDWRNHLSTAQIARFDQLSGDLLKELGYKD
ncbi:MAG: sulfotransferase [Acidobacteria bacterium]|nr:sulfotransferase [Acidobacteriota bacterium]